MRRLFISLSLTTLILLTVSPVRAQITPDESIRMGDPFVLLDGDSYYLYGTTGGGGFKSWKSKNLKNWESIGKVYTWDNNSYGKGSFWAPEVRKYRDKYYLTYSAKGREEKSGFKLCLAVADSPAGPFTDLATPWLEFEDWSCIDADIFIDDDGTPYCFFNKVGVIEDPWHLYGIIYMVKLSDDLLKAETEPVLVVQAEQEWEAMDPEKKSSCNEGAFVFKWEDKYYLTYSSGHYASPLYGIGYATADSPFGPWEKSDKNPLLQSDLSNGISGPGHNSITWSPDKKKMYIVYHIHSNPQKPSGDRKIKISRLKIDKKGNLKVIK